MKIKKGDKVKVIAGKNKGTIGAVLEVKTQKNRVVVEGVNVRKKAVKLSESNTENFIYIQHSIHASNVKKVDDEKDGNDAKKIEKNGKVEKPKAKSKRSSK